MANLSKEQSPSDKAWEELCGTPSTSIVTPGPLPRTLTTPHPFAKLGDGPWRFEGVEHATTGGRRCALCGKSIKNLYIISGADRFPHTLGSECVLSMGNGFERHLVGQVKTAKSRFDKAQRAAARAKREAREAADNRANSLQDYPAEIAFLEGYTGTFDFYLSLKGQFARNGFLSEKQWGCVSRALVQQKEFEAKKAAPRSFSLEPKTVLIVSKFLGHCIAREFGLNRPHFAIEVTEVQAESEKAYKVKGKLTAHRTSHCCVCGLGLTNPVSVQNGIGPICGERWGVTTTEELQAKIATEYRAEITLWIPKSQIKERKTA